MKRVINIVLASVIAFMFSSCNRKAATIDPTVAYLTYTDTSPGIKDLEVVAIYPSDESTLVSRTSPVIVVFTKPVVPATVVENTNVILTGGGGVTLDAPTFSADNTIATFTHAGYPTLDNNSSYTVTINTAGVTGADLEILAAYSDPTLPAGHHFTTIDSDGEEADAIPVALDATRYPVPASTASKALDYVEVTFSEEMDPLTVTLGTFTIAGSIGGITATGVTTVNNRTFRLELNNATVDYSEAVTVTLNAGITSSIATGSIPLSGTPYTWIFSIEASPVPGAVTIGSVWVTDVTDTTARINWTTNKSVTVSGAAYGVNPSLGSNQPDVTPGDTHHYADLAGLTPATRYYYQVTSDGVSLPLAAGAPYYFMTDGILASNIPLSTEAGDKTNITAVKNTGATGSYDGSSFVVWVNGVNIKAAYFNNDAAGTLQWGGLDGSVLDSNVMTDPKAFIDSRGSLLVTMESGGNIYLKKVFNNAGTIDFPDFDWPANSGVPGITVGSGTMPHISIVWANPVNINADGNSVSVIRPSNPVVVLPPGNWFYDFSVDFTATTLALNDAVLDRTSAPWGLSLVTNAGTTYRHSVNQNIANIVATDTYLIGDGVTNFGSFLATDHTMHLGTNYINGTTFVYTIHGFTVPGWLGLNDIVFNGINGAIISGAGISALIPTSIDSGTANADRTDHLIDGSADFVVAGVVIGCYAMNTADNNYAQVTGVAETDLTLTLDIFPNGNEGYIVFSLGSELTYGSASGTSAGQLVDSSNIFDAVPIGSFVLNTTSNKMAVVVAGSSGHNLSLSSDIFPLGTENYEIWTGSQLTTGTASADWLNHLIDGGVDFTSLGWDVLPARRHAVNTGDNKYANVTAVAIAYLALSTDIFPAGTENYAVYNLTVDAPLESGTSDATPVAGKLVDYTAGTDFYTIAVGSFAMNTTAGTITTISAKDVNGLAVNNDIFVSADTYNIYTASNSQSGLTTSTSVGELNDTGTDFTLIGWLDTTNCYAINMTAPPYTIAKITGIAQYVLTLDNDIFTAPGFNENYTIVFFVSVDSGTADVTVAGELVQTTKDFSAVAAGSYVVDTTPDPDQVTTVTALISHSVDLTADIFTAGSESYDIVTSSVALGAGSASAYRASHLIDGSALFTLVAGLNAGDYVKNTATDSYATVVTITDTDLELTADIFPGGNEGYQVIELTSQIGGSGTASGTSPGELVDADRWFSGISVPAPPSYIYVLNITTGKVATVASVAGSTTLNLNDDIFVAGDSYQIWSGTQLASGTANADRLNHLIDGSALWTSAPVVNLNDLVINTGTSGYDLVTTVTDTDLEFASDVFPNGNEGYQIYHDYCVTALHYSGGDAVNQFYQLQVDYNINTSAGDTIQYFDNKGITGTADALPANPLLDNDGLLDFTLITAANDYVFNLTSGNLAQVNAVPYTRALELTANIFTVTGDLYTILRTTPYIVPGSIVAYGNVDSIAGDQFEDTTAAFAGVVEKGDLVYNVTDGTYSVVISVDDNTHLTLNKGIMAALENYIVFGTSDRLTETGINTTSGVTLTDANADFTNVSNPVKTGDIVRNNNTGLQTLVVSVDSPTQLTLQSAATFPAINQRYVVLQPRIFVAYQRTTGPFTEIYGEIFRLNDGSDCGITVSIYTGAIATNVQTAPDNNGNTLVVYEVGGANIYAKRFNAAGTDLDSYAVTVPGTLITNTAGYLIRVLPGDSGSIYILYENGTNVYLQKRSSALATIWGPTMVAANATDSVLEVDSSNQPMVAYAETATGYIRITKYTTAGAALYTAMPVNTLTIGTYGTYYRNSDSHRSNISMVTDGTTGAVISWIDTRFMADVGFTIHALGITAAGGPDPAWDADSGAGTDWNGVKIGIIGSDLAADISFTSVNYNDGGAWNPRIIWQDYRSGISDLYYDDFSY